MTSDTLSLKSRIDALQSTGPELPAFFQRASEAVPTSAEGRRIEMIVNALEHQDDIAGGDLRPAWDALTSRLEAAADGSSDDGGVSFLADAIRVKALAMIALNQVRDYTDMSELITKSGHSGAKTVLATFDEDAHSPEGLPLGTILVRRLGTVRPRKRASVSNGTVAVSDDPTAEEWTDVTATCTTLAALLIADVAGPGPAEWGPAEIAAAIDERGLESWRSILETIGDDPWSPVAQDLTRTIPTSSDKGAATALREALLLVRKRTERAEQKDVASRVAEYIASTGITQRAFSARIGTSPSRLSTYANGSVTPSAAMMLRIAKVSARIAADKK